MDKELLMLYGALYAVREKIEKGSSAYGKKLDDGRLQTVDLVDICDYLAELIDKYKIERNGEK